MNNSFLFLHQYSVNKLCIFILLTTSSLVLYVFSVVSKSTALSSFILATNSFVFAYFNLIIIFWNKNENTSQLTLSCTIIASRSPTAFLKTSSSSIFSNNCLYQVMKGVLKLAIKIRSKN